MNKKIVLIFISVLVVFGLTGIFLLTSFISQYNRMVTLNEDIDAKWAQVENQLQRRADLIPNLVETVKRYVKEEETIFTNIAEARSRIGSARNVNEQMEAEGELGGFLSRLLMITENYPDLKASEQFKQLQSQLEGTENRISVERKRYNESVQAYNTSIKQFPAKFYAMLSGFEPREFFEASSDAQAVPVVNFGEN